MSAPQHRTSRRNTVHRGRRSAGTRARNSRSRRWLPLPPIRRGTSNRRSRQRRYFLRLEPPRRGLRRQPLAGRKPGGRRRCSQHNTSAPPDRKGDSPSRPSRRRRAARTLSNGAASSPAGSPGRSSVRAARIQRTPPGSPAPARAEAGGWLREAVIRPCAAEPSRERICGVPRTTRLCGLRHAPRADAWTMPRKFDHFALGPSLAGTRRTRRCHETRVPRDGIHGAAATA